MAMFTVALQNSGGIEEKVIYPQKENLQNLLYYLYNKKQAVAMGNLYPLGIDCIFHQMCYLQERRVKPLRTRALHYILSFDSQGYENEIGVEKICDIMNLLSAVLFVSYQHIFYLHTDRPTHLHVHMIVNPVNIETRKVYEKSSMQVGQEIAYWLAAIYQIPVQNFSYRDLKGRIIFSKETEEGLYQDKMMEKWGIKLPQSLF